jgi:hypothetical protein
MKARSEHEGEPSILDDRARLAAVKTPHAVRPRRRRADGLDGAEDEPRTAAIDGCPRPWRQAVVLARLRAHDAPQRVSGAPSIVVNIGHETRIFHAFVTSAPAAFDAPATLTLYASTSSDLAGFVADDAAFAAGEAQSAARLVLVDALELTWQRARYRETGHPLVPADAAFVEPRTLQRWLWRRLLALPYDEVTSHGTDTSSR